MSSMGLPAPVSMMISHPWRLFEQGSVIEIKKFYVFFSAQYDECVLLHGHLRLTQESSACELAPA